MTEGTQYEIRVVAFPSAIPLDCRATTRCCASSRRAIKSGWCCCHSRFSMTWAACSEPITEETARRQRRQRFRPVASRSTPQRRLSTADAATPGATQGRPTQDAVAATLEPPSADPTPPAEPLICPHLSPRAADLHPHAHVRAGDGTMIRSSHQPPPSGLAAACPATPRRSAVVTNSTHRPPWPIRRQPSRKRRFQS
jgi:hypothetical protein